MRKSSDVYGGSLGLQTTVNIGFRLLKPAYTYQPGVKAKQEKVRCFALTANRKFGTTSDELEEIPSLSCRELAHSL